ncbi:MAG: HEPN domain-containing protein [Candidatus Aquicultorales bacterium]
MQAAEQSLKDARTILAAGVCPAARDEAYQAMLKAGMAVVLAHGYRVEAGSHHLTTVRIVTELLGSHHRGVTKTFNDLRRQRNDRLYDGVDICTADQASRAIDRAEALIAVLKQKQPSS